MLEKFVKKKSSKGEGIKHGNERQRLARICKYWSYFNTTNYSPQYTAQEVIRNMEEKEKRKSSSSNISIGGGCSGCGGCLGGCGGGCF